MEIMVKKILVTTTALALMCSTAFAQTSTGSGPQGDSMTKPGMANGSTQTGSMKKGSMNNTGMNSGANRGYVQPNASGQGGSGPNSDQGGTRTAPNNLK